MRVRADSWRYLLLLGALGCERSEPPPPSGAGPDENIGRSDSVATARPEPPATQPAASRPGTALAGPPQQGVAREPPASPSSAADDSRGADGPRCRVMSVSGKAARAGAPLRAGDTLDQQLPVELGEASTLHLVHTASARQWTLRGPARLFACDRGAEEIVLALGSLRTEPGSGVRPGAEVWVGTPYGSLRYSDARAEIGVTPEALSVRVSSGEVWFTPLVAEPLAERALASGTTTFPARTHRLAYDAARERCEHSASAADSLAIALLEPSQRTLGERAREHVRARQTAHASCSGALAVLLAGDPGASSGTLDDAARAGYAELARFDRLWRDVPARAAARRP